MAEHLPVSYNVPPEMMDSVKKNVAFMIYLCPGWVASIQVDWEKRPAKEDTHTICMIHADYKYRKVYLTFYPAWLSMNDEIRKQTIIHETVHILTAATCEFFNDVVKPIFDESSDIEKALEGAWTAANEAVTEDLALVLLKQNDKVWDAGWDACLAAYGLEDEITTE